MTLQLIFFGLRNLRDGIEVIYFLDFNVDSLEHQRGILFRIIGVIFLSFTCLFRSFKSHFSIQEFILRDIKINILARKFSFTFFGSSVLRKVCLTHRRVLELFLMYAWF